MMRRAVAVCVFALVFGGFGYSAVGDVEVAWVHRYDGPGGENDSPRSIAIDSDGNVYATGQVWIGSAARYGAGTIKLSPEGDLLWERAFDHMGFSDLGSSIALDDSGNVYVFGFADSQSTIPNGRDFLLIKYDADGNEQWATVDDGGFGLEERPRRVVVAPDGGVYAAGSTRHGSGIGDFYYLTVRYSAVGSVEWMRTHNGSDNGQDQVEAIAVDSQSNVIVTGRTREVGTGQDITTIKYAPDGTELWVRVYNNDGVDGNDVGNGIAVDADDNIYVVGTSAGGATGDDAVVLKYDPDGNLEWVVRYDGPISGNDRGSAVTIDADGNVLVAGAAETAATQRNILVFKLDPDGDLLWDRYDHSGPLGEHDSAREIVADSAGNVYVNGTVRAPGSVGGVFGVFDTITMAFDADGERLWLHEYDGPVNGGDFGRGLVVDEGRSAAYALSESFGGSFTTGDTGWDYVVIRYDFGDDCPPDWNGDGVVDSDDLFDFLADWAAGNADYNGDGVTDSDDLFDFLADWAEGC